MMNNPLQEWYPVRIIEDDLTLVVQWMRFGEPDFKEPFFDDAIAQARITYPENRKKFRSVTSLDILVGYQENWNQDVSLLVFHVSRCGSTLLAQLLTEIPNTTVLSEVPLLDEIIALGIEGRVRDSKVLFKSVVRILGLNAQRIILKTDSWHLLHFDFYRECNSKSPAVMLHRKPSEIIASHKRIPGMQTAQNLLRPAQLNGLVVERGENELPSLYFCRLLEQFYLAICGIVKSDALSLSISYETGAHIIFGEAIKAMHLEIDNTTKIRVEERGKYNSKMPATVFSKEMQTEPMENADLNNAYAKVLELMMTFVRNAP